CSSHPQIKLAKGLDHPFLLKKNSKQPAASLNDPESGRTVEVRTDSQAIVIYTHNHEMIEMGMKPYSGITFETQMVPDAIHLPEFKETVTVTPETPFRTETT